MKRQSIGILGSTGSIGTQAIEVIQDNIERYEVDFLTANSNAELLIQQAIQLMPNAVIIYDETQYSFVKESLSHLPIKVFCSEQSAIDYIDVSECQTVLAAISGFAGLMPVLKAIEKKKRIALANKEVLVVAGEIVKSMVEKYRVDFIPVDSEHSALFQCLMGEDLNQVDKIILTASGGPFRSFTKQQLQTVKASQALCHPTWKMGNKITIDSATLMNKGLEVIEAFWLFGFMPEQIDVLIHPQSVIHSMVQFSDGSMKAQLSKPDMKIPIQLAFSFPYRHANSFEKTTISHLANLTFELPDHDRFPCLSLAYEALKKGGNTPCILNAANEIAVDAYLKDQIGFYDIPRMVQESISKISLIQHPTLQQLIDTDKETRIFARSII